MSSTTSGALVALDHAPVWLNSEPLTAAALRGRVVLVDFWTYSCVNWLRTLPYVRAWAERYRDRGLVVVGAHAPEFGFEHDLDNVRRAIAELDVAYPVVIDNDFSIWRAFDNHYWPAVYLVDGEGRVRFQHFGEEAYAETERAIQQLLGIDEETRARRRRRPRGSNTSNRTSTRQAALRIAHPARHRYAHRRSTQPRRDQSAAAHPHSQDPCVDDEPTQGSRPRTRGAQSLCRDRRPLRRPRSRRHDRRPRCAASGRGHRPAHRPAARYHAQFRRYSDDYMARTDPDPAVVEPQLERSRRIRRGDARAHSRLGARRAIVPRTSSPISSSRSTTTAIICPKTRSSCT